MNLHRRLIPLAATAMLAVFAVPASAQLLGGSAGGALGGTLGAGGLHGTFDGAAGMDGSLGDPGLRDHARGALDRTREGVAVTRDRTQGAVQGTRERTQEAVQATRDRTQDRVSTAHGNAADGVERTRERVRQVGPRGALVIDAGASGSVERREAQSSKDAPTAEAPASAAPAAE